METVMREFVPFIFNLGLITFGMIAYAVASFACLCIGGLLSLLAMWLRGRPRVERWWSSRAIFYPCKRWGDGVGYPIGLFISPCLLPLLLCEAAWTLVTPQRSAA